MGNVYLNGRNRTKYEILDDSNYPNDQIVEFTSTGELISEEFLRTPQPNEDAEIYENSLIRKLQRKLLDSLIEHGMIEINVKEHPFTLSKIYQLKIYAKKPPNYGDPMWEKLK